MTTTAFSDLIFKFDAVTDASEIESNIVQAGGDNSPLALDASGGVHGPGAHGISFNLQIVEKGNPASSSTNFESSIVGTVANEIDNETSKALANLITKFFALKSILRISETTAATGVGRNIRSMKLIVNIDPTA